MGCFCHASLTPLERQAAHLHTPVEDEDGPATPDAATPGHAGLGAPPHLPRPALSGAPHLPSPVSGTPHLPSPALSGAPPHLPHQEVPGGALVPAVASWLAARGLPAAPWQPDPEWLALTLPMPRMDAAAVASISALVHLRTTVLAQFDIDLLVPAQSPRLSRIVTTMNARLTHSPLAKVDPKKWIQLAARNDAIDQVQAAHKSGLLAAPPHLVTAMTHPGGIPIGKWASLLAPLRRLAPLIAAAMQLNVPVTDAAPLAEALRLLARVTLPPLAAPDLTHGLAAALGAIARLRSSLGANPLHENFHALQERVWHKQRVLMTALAARHGAALVTDAAPGAFLEKLPKLPVAPGSLATADAIRMAMRSQPLAAADWRVPPLPSIQIGLSTCALVAQMQAVLGVAAVLPAPCGSGCDAASLLRAVA